MTAQIDYPQAVTPTQAEAKRFDSLKFAMWLYLGSETVLFMVLIAAYVVFRVNEAEAVQRAQEALSIPLVGANTFLLLTSSWAMVRGLLAIQRGNQKGLVRWFGLMVVLGTLFVILQGVEYLELAHEGITIYTAQGAEPALYEFGARFYALTAFHGFHVIIGVLWGLFVMRNAARGRYTATNYIGVEIFGLYWHFVDVVWIFLFTLIYLI
jgi:cytochrome c oxidase subunit 3